MRCCSLAGFQTPNNFAGIHVIKLIAREYE